MIARASSGRASASLPPRCLPQAAAVLIGVVLSEIAVLLAGPLLVDYIVQGLLEIPPAGRGTLILLLDTALTALGFTATFWLAARWARAPRARVVTGVALIDLVILVGMRVSAGTYRSAITPLWYEIALVATIALAWWVASRLVATEPAQ